MYRMPDRLIIDYQQLPQFAGQCPRNLGELLLPSVSLNAVVVPSSWVSNSTVYPKSRLFFTPSLVPATSVLYVYLQDDGTPLRNYHPHN